MGEVTMSLRRMLGIFFGLCALAAGFFGFIAFIKAIVNAGDQPSGRRPSLTKILFSVTGDWRLRLAPGNDKLLNSHHALSAVAVLLLILSSVLLSEP